MITLEYKQRIAEILRAAARIEEITRGLTRQDFLADRARVAATSDELVRIGQAVGGLPRKIRQRYPAIDWNAWPAGSIAGDDALWAAATRRVPAFAGQVNRILFDITD
jgi:hypothetical protein